MANVHLDLAEIYGQSLISSWFDSKPGQTLKNLRFNENILLILLFKPFISFVLFQTGHVEKAAVIFGIRGPY